MRAYLSTFRMRRKLELQYRGAVLGGIVCQIFFGLILVAIYRAMYAGKPQDIPLQQITSYVWLHAVRASAGGAEHLRVAHTVNLVRAIADLKEAGCWMTGLDWGEDARPYTAIDFRGRVGLVVGAEGAGISRLVRENCDFIAELPMPGGFESLNAGVAAAVTMYEILRQRGK